MIRDGNQPVGDVLRSGSWTRTVTGIGGMRGDQIRYTRTHGGTGHSEPRYCDTHEGWWRWAKTAEVVKPAEALAMLKEAMER